MMVWVSDLLALDAVHFALEIPPEMERVKANKARDLVRRKRFWLVNGKIEARKKPPRCANSRGCDTPDSVKESKMPAKSTPQCLVCGGPVDCFKNGNPKKTCSETCREERQRIQVQQWFDTNIRSRPTVERTCEHCGGCFLTHTWDVKRGRGRFCSQVCRAQAVPANPSKPKVEVTCETCGKIFAWNPSRAKTAKYCSRKCYGIAKRDHSASVQCLLTCKRCGKQFGKTRREIRKAENPKQMRTLEFCSQECNIAFHRGFGDSKRRNKSGATGSWRSKVLARDNYTCQRCNRADLPLHAHHIKPWAHFPALRYSVSNGQTLCEDCHRAVHSAAPQHVF